MSGPVFSVSEGEHSGDLNDLRQRVLDSLGALIVTKDREGRYTYANRIFCQWVGAPLESVIGRKARDFFDEATAGQVEAVEQEVIETCRLMETHASFLLTSSGESRRFLAVKSPLLDREGRVVGLSSVYVDVTERERTAALLQESRAILDTVMANVDAHIYMKDENRRYLFVSRKVAQLFQRSTEEMIGHTSEELLEEEQAESFRALDDRVYAQGGHHAGEECFRVGGQMRYYWSVKLLLERPGQTNCLVGFSSDITELKLAEHALARSEARFRTLFEASSEAVFVFNRSLVLLDCNPAALTLLGLSRKEECMGRCLKDLSPPAQPCGMPSAELLEEYLQVADRKGRHRFEWMLRSAGQDELVPVEVVISAMSLDGVPAFLATLRDLTERKQYESKIHQLAFYDALTELPNRRLFFDRLAKALAQSQRSGLYGAVIYLDLDNFKPVNDHYGHRAGDQVLQEAARRLSHSIREQDTVARLGGDEFVVLLVHVAKSEETAMAMVRQVAARILEDLGKPYLIPGAAPDGTGAPVAHSCSASLGLTLFPPCELDGEAILKRADDAMYQAKSEGRSRIRMDRRPPA